MQGPPAGHTPPSYACDSRTANAMVHSLPPMHLAHRCWVYAGVAGLEVERGGQAGVA